MLAGEEGTKSMLAYISLKDFLSDPKQENVCARHHNMHMKVVNVLLIGRSQAGKSTLLATLLNPQQAVQGRCFSVTREPQITAFVLNDDRNNISYTINVIDTPGLTEKRIDNLKSREDEELIRIIKYYISNKITYLNIVIYVTVAKRTHELDAEAFQHIRTFLGDEFESNSLLVISHCEEIPKKRFEQILKDMKTFPETNIMINYCKLGVLPYGTMNADFLSLADEDNNNIPTEKEKTLRKITERVHDTYKRIEKMRQNLFLAIISTANRPRLISQLGRNYYIKEQERMVIISAFDVAKKVWDNELKEKEQYVNIHEVVTSHCKDESFEETNIQHNSNGSTSKLKQADKTRKASEIQQAVVLAEQKLYVIKLRNDRKSHSESNKRIKN